MVTPNPYLDDPDRGPAWDLGYADGYADPEVDHQPPVAAELTDVFREGELAGRDDRRSEVPFGPPPPGNGGHSIPPDGEADQHAVEAVHVLLDVGVHVGLERMFEAAGGLIALVLTALQVPTDTPMRAPDPDWIAPADGWGATYVAVCPDVHMDVAASGVTPDGYWAAPIRQTYAEAEADVAAHGDTSAFVALCSLDRGLCGPVTRAEP